MNALETWKEIFDATDVAMIDVQTDAHGKLTRFVMFSSLLPERIVSAMRLSLAVEEKAAPKNKRIYTVLVKPTEHPPEPALFVLIMLAVMIWFTPGARELLIAFGDALFK